MHVMRIFFPDYAIKVQSGVCIGWVDYQTHTICILTVVHLPVDLRNIQEQLQKETCVRQKPLVVIGPFTQLSDPERDTILQLCRDLNDGPCVEFTRLDAYSLPMCTLLQDGQPIIQDNHFILYSQSEVLACCLSVEDKEEEETTEVSPSGQPSTQTTLSSHGDGRRTEGRTVLRIASVLHVIQEGVKQLSVLKDRDISIDVKMQRTNKSSAVHRLSSYLFLGFLSFVQFSLLPFRSNLCGRLSKKTVFQTLLKFTQTGSEIQAKYIALQSVLNTNFHEANDNQHHLSEKAKMKNKSKSRCEHLRAGDLLAFLVADTLLGLLLIWWIQHSNLPGVWAEGIISSANTTAESLQKLLQWLMGAPAGLKLNSALAHFLGQFFLYHVYLWIGYLSMMQPVLDWVIWCMSLTGCLGVSVTLAVASDMVSMLTFHIYCFYVYAARLYHLQLTGLLALSRLFRGRKWNVLRKRVDTCNYDVDQLFIGTLLFTILLFLLPTTALFYAVFTGLRLAIIALKGVLTKTIEVLKRLPAYSTVLCLTGANVLCSGVKFEVLEQPGKGCSSAVVMEVQHMGIYDTLQLSYNATAEELSKCSSSTTGPRNPVLAFGSDIITGRLIYPWGFKHLKEV